jgi:hypothetical protein
MRNQDTGEFELVVGNRQLLSGFFIVVLLFAVAFAMGYVVGQNSPRSTRVGDTASAAQPSSPDNTRPQPAPAPPANPPEAPAASPSTPDSAADTPPADAPPQPVTQAPRDAAPATPAVTPAEAPLPAGSYWQAIAVPKPDAEVIAKALKDRGLPVLLNQGPNNLVRVLVGPYNDVTAMGKAKTELENAGFHPFRK